MTTLPWYGLLGLALIFGELLGSHVEAPQSFLFVKEVLEVLCLKGRNHDCDGFAIRHFMDAVWRCKTQVGPGSWIRMTQDKSLKDEPQVLLGHPEIWGFVAIFSERIVRKACCQVWVSREFLLFS